MWQRLLLFAALAGCGSGSSSNAVHGTIRGNPYPVADAISATLTSFGTSLAFIVLSSSTDVCLPPDAQIQHPGEKTVVILLQEGDRAPTGPGTYTVVDPGSSGPPPARVAVLSTSVLDAMCLNNADNGTVSISGSVTLDSISGGAYAGTFDVLLDSGDHITGSFQPTACDLLPAELQGGSTPACKP